MSSVPAILEEGRALDAVLVGAAGIGISAGAGLAAFATRDVFSQLHEDVPVSSSALCMLAAGGIIVAIMRIVSRTWAERLGQSFAIALRHVLYRHLAGMSCSDVAGRRAGALGLRFVGDLSAARGWVSLGLTRILSAAFVLPGAALALYLLNPALAAATALPIAGTVLAMLGLAVLLQPLHRRLRANRASIAISMMERVAVAPELDLMGRTRKELKSLDRDGALLRRRAVRRMGIASCLRAVPEIGLAIAGAALLWTTSHLGVPAADAAGALAILGILALPLRELAGVWDRRCAWVIAREKCEAVLSKPSTRRRPRRAWPPAIAFDGVAFRGLRIDEVIEAGETVLVGGPSGSGKSSFLKLAAGLESPEHGSVTYGDGSRIPKTVYIGPDSPILQGSLRRALTLGVSPRPDDATIAEAAGAFGLAPLMARLHGLDGRVGEAGRTLASGERLCVHLARAMLAEPDLLIIDAPLAGTDPDLIARLRLLISEVDATVIMTAPEGLLDGLADRHLRTDAWRSAGRDLERDPVSAVRAQAG